MASLISDWEVIADNLSKSGWSWGCVSAIDSNGRIIWIVDAHRGDGKCFVVRADEKLTAFMELESVIHESFPVVKSALV
jgi:predicted secreted Zn-dependent protease